MIKQPTYMFQKLVSKLAPSKLSSQTRSSVNSSDFSLLHEITAEKVIRINKYFINLPYKNV